MCCLAKISEPTWVLGGFQIVSWVELSHKFLEEELSGSKERRRWNQCAFISVREVENRG